MVVGVEGSYGAEEVLLHEHKNASSWYSCNGLCGSCEFTPCYNKPDWFKKQEEEKGE